MADSARKHHIDETDNRVRMIGLATDGTMLEVVVLDPFTIDPVMVHAMTARRKFLKPPKDR